MHKILFKEIADTLKFAMNQLDFRLLGLLLRGEAGYLLLKFGDLVAELASCACSGVCSPKIVSSISDNG